MSPSPKPMAFDPLTQEIAGPHSIEASAGTGKTYSITLLWLRLLVEKELTVEEILVSTFTKAATAELRERLLAALRNARRAAACLASDEPPPEGPEALIVTRRHAAGVESADSIAARLTQATSQFDLAPILTIHGFCQSLIARHALELGCDTGASLVEDIHPVLDPLVDDQLMKMADSGAPDVERMRNIAEAVAANGVANLCTAGRVDELRERSVWENLSQAQNGALTGLKGSVRAKVERQLGEFARAGTWEKFSDAAAKALPPDFNSSWMELGEILKRKALQPAAQVARSVRTRLAAQKNQVGVWTFDDLVQTVRVALQKQGPDGLLARAVRSRLRAAIIDECQDSDGSQIEVFEKLFHDPSVAGFLVIGDPKQSIYRFRGADLTSYKKLVGITKAAPQMDTNRRSDRPLVDALNRLFGQHTFPDALLPDNPTLYIPVKSAAESRIADACGNAALVFQWSPAEKAEAAKAHLARMVALECTRLLSAAVAVEDRHTGQKRPLHAGDIAVLAADHRQLSLVRRHLMREGISCQSSGNSLGSVFGSAEAQDILAWLQMLAALERKESALGRLLAFLGTPLGGKSACDLERVRVDSGEQAREYAELQQQLNPLRLGGPLPLLLERMGAADVLRANLAFAEGERRYANWRQIGVLLQKEHARGRRSADSLAAWLGRHMTGGSSSISDGENRSESALMRLETDAPAVQLVTVHASKGLEYPVVFCPFLWFVKSRQNREKASTALLRDDAGWILDVGSDHFDAHLARALAQEDEEEHRKLYVALTRARHRLYLGLAPVKAGRGNHQNGAKDSSLAQLPGLQIRDAEPGGWLGVLQDFKEATVQEYGKLLARAGTADGTASTNSGGARPLARPAPCLPYSFPPSKTLSFTALSKSEGEHLPGADHDVGVDSNSNDVPSGACDPLAPLLEKGAALGERLHGVLEDYLGNKRPLEEAVRGCPQVPEWFAAVRKILDAPILLPNETAFTLECIRGNAITEMQFHLPVVRMNPKTLSQTLLRDPYFADHPDRCAWAGRIEKHWRFIDFSGFMKGYIDLVFEHDGRWYIADYKSNKLESYDADALEHAMEEHHYFLQARLYAAALHRHLRANLSEYQYEKHFGGVAYLFVRGFPQRGVWFDRPSESALKAIEQHFTVAACNP